MPPNADARSSEAPANPSRTRRLGKYRIEKQIGAGGMGSVFLAVDSELQRTVALKILPKERAANPQLVKRFKSEGAAAARLEHENIVRVFDAGEIDGYLYLALEYVDGIDVQQLVAKRDRLPVRRSVEIVTQVASALQHAYERGIVHRDIKPSNLLIRKDGVVKLADMGLARAIDETTEAGITHAGMTVGTVDYISPEQGADSKRADIRSDLYSLGCSWYHMLTGQVPYPDGAASDKLRAHNIGPIPDPRQLNERIPRAVVAVLHRLMAKKPEERYQTPQELIDELSQPSLLQRETGAADIAGLALAASEAAPESSVTTREPSLRDIVDEETNHGEFASTAAAPELDKRRKRSSTSKSSRTKAGRRNGRSGKDGNASKEQSQRSERPEQFAVDHSSIDPDQLKLAGIGLVGLIVLFSLGWVGWRYVQTSGDSLSPAGANPFVQTRVENPEPAPPPVVDTAPPSIPRPEPPPPSISEFQPESPFPGAAGGSDDLSAGAVPRWVYVVREQAPAEGWSIDVDPESTSGPGTIQEALRQLPSNGGVIVFKGRGPHIVAPLDFGGSRNVVLRAAEGDAPVLLWQSSESNRQRGLTASGGRLELDGLHIVASGRSRDDSTPLIDAEHATVLIRNCTVTLANPASEPVPFVRLSRHPSGPSRCVLENVFVRGNNVSAALLDGPGHELVTGNCLFASGDAPVVTCRDPSGTSDDAGNAGTSARLLASVAVTRDSVFQCERRDGSSEAAVLLKTRYSTFVGQAADATALRLENWPEAPAGELDRSRAVGVEFEFERTRWLHWAKLTEFQPAGSGSPVLVGNSAQWLQFWRSPLGGVDDDPQTADPVFEDYQSVSPDEVLAAAGEPESAAAPPGPGLNTSLLPGIPENLVSRLVAFSARPRTPQDIDAAFGGGPVRIDLKRNGLKLNEVLNGPECPDGSHVVLFASKRALIEPVILSDKSLKIEFDGEGDPLLVQPVARSSTDRPSALFRVERGRLDLVNGHLRIPSSSRTSYPLRILEVVDGSFAVRNCLLYGQIGTGSEGAPTIEWRPEKSDSTQFGLIENSLVAGDAQAVHATLAGQLLDVQNSIVVTGGDCFRLTPAATAGRSTVSVSNSTLSAADAFFRLAPETESDSIAGSLQVFVNQTIYGPPIARSDGPILLVQQHSASQNPDVGWWEISTAIFDGIKRFRVTDEAASATQDFTKSCLRGWGPEHLDGVIYEPLGVALTAKDINLSKTQPTDWELDPKSLAATAGPENGPLGVTPNWVGPDGAPVQSNQNVQNSPTKRPTRKSRQADF